MLYNIGGDRLLTKFNTLGMRKAIYILLFLHQNLSSDNNIN